MKKYITPQVEVITFLAERILGPSGGTMNKYDKHTSAPQLSQQQSMFGWGEEEEIF